MVNPTRESALDRFGIAAGFGGGLVGLAVVQQNLLLVAGIAFLACVFPWPVEISLGVFAFLVPWDDVLELGDSGVTLARLAGAFAGAILLAYGFLSGRLRVPARSALLRGLFVLWSAASFLWAIDPARSLERLGTAVSLFGLYLVVASFDITRRELARILVLTAAGGALAGAVVICQFVESSGFYGPVYPPTSERLEFAPMPALVSIRSWWASKPDLQSTPW